MAITEADVRFRASQRMTDFPDGGGRMSSTVIVDGEDNNVFDDITDIERLQGRLSLRKVFPAVLNAGNESYRSAHVLLDDGPDDAATSAFVFASGSVTSERAAAIAALSGAVVALPVVTFFSSGFSEYYAMASFTGGGTSLTWTYDFSAGDTIRAPDVGSTVSVTYEGVSYLRKVAAASVDWTAGPGSDKIVTVTVDVALPGSGAGLSAAMRFLSAGTTRCFGVSIAAGTPGGASATVAETWVRAVPVDLGTALPAHNDQWGTVSSMVTAEAWIGSHGRVPIFAAGDAVLVHHTQAMSPAAVSNGQTVSAGRTGLSRLRVIGNNGTVHARFTSGQPAPSGVGCTADLVAGTVTFSDVSGMSQPVTVEHRIEEMLMLLTVNPSGALTFNRSLSRTYPSGTKVSSLLMIGDLQGRTQLGFAQLAWTSVWSDTRIGGEPPGDFNMAGHPIVCTNAGAVTERWTCIFTNTTNFRVIGEGLGEISPGSTGTDYAPINPATGAPYFTIPAAGWGGGWSAQNVWRFNTAGANTQVQVARCVAPSVPSGTDSVTLQLRGYVNT